MIREWGRVLEREPGLIFGDVGCWMLDVGFLMCWIPRAFAPACFAAAAKAAGSYSPEKQAINQAVWKLVPDGLKII